MALKYSSLFGEDFYLELQDHGMPEQQQVNQALMRIHQETGISLVVTNDSHYIKAEDAEDTIFFFVFKLVSQLILG